MARASSRTGLNARRIAQLESRIGHHFKTHERLVRALTHSSATRRGEDVDYERLEFLGDRVLGLCVSENLFRTFPKAVEGELSVRLNALVSGETCAAIADEIGLAEFIHANTGARQLSGKRMKSVRADVVESLIAAIYLDAGLEAASAFVDRHWGGRVHEAGAATQDSKTALQEWSHAAKAATPLYTIVERSGPDHDPLFRVSVAVVGIEDGTGEGRSKRAAEQAAARAVLVREGVWNLSDDGSVEAAK